MHSCVATWLFTASAMHAFVTRSPHQAPAATPYQQPHTPPRRLRPHRCVTSRVHVLTCAILPCAAFCKWYGNALLDSDAAVVSGICRATTGTGAGDRYARLLIEYLYCATPQRRTAAAAAQALAPPPGPSAGAPSDAEGREGAADPPSAGAGGGGCTAAEGARLRLLAPANAAPRHANAWLPWRAGTSFFWLDLRVVILAQFPLPLTLTLLLADLVEVPSQRRLRPQGG